jgi:hypothetical protein
MPGPSSAAVTLAIGTLGTAGVGAALWSAAAAPLAIGLTLGAGAITALALTHRGRRFPALGGVAAGGAREVAMAIVPWGVIVTPDTDPRVLRWPAIRKVAVDVTHSMRGGTPAILSSFVSVHTEREILAGRAPGAVDLERLVANLDAYTEEASRPAASDIDGREAAGDDASEPVAGLLIRHAEELCASGKGAARLALPSGGYRVVATRKAAPETLTELHGALDADLDAPADPRPVAAIAAGILGASELVPDLLRLVSSPHPMVAAFAKAAALRLGAPRSRAGSFDELGAFLFEEDLEAIRAWASRAGAGAEPAEAF